LNLHDITQDTIALHIKLHKTEKRYNRIKWIFKPITILGFIALAITSLLPFLLPFTAPLILAMVAAFVLRLIVYKYVFGDPESKFNKAVKSIYTPAFISLLSEDAIAEKPMGITSESINTSKLFLLKADTVYHEATYRGNIENAQAEFGQITIANDDITLSAILSSIGEDVIDGLTGLNTEFGHEKNLNNKKFFKGFYAEITLPKTHEHFLIVTEAIADTYQKKSPFVKSWHVQKIVDTTFCILSKSGEANLPQGFTDSIKDFEKAGARKAIISMMGNKLAIAFPWGMPHFTPNFEENQPVKEAFIELFTVQSRLVLDLVNNSLK
jgi:hypothetical protein